MTARLIQITQPISTYPASTEADELALTCGVRFASHLDLAAMACSACLKLLPRASWRFSHKRLRFFPAFLNFVHVTHAAVSCNDFEHTACTSCQLGRSIASPPLYYRVLKTDYVYRYCYTWQLSTATPCTTGTRCVSQDPFTVGVCPSQ